MWFEEVAVPNSYREIFAAPGAVGFSAAGFVARLPWAMTTLGIVTMLSQARGDYTVAGAVAATFAFANALIAPQLSRLMDRHGQRRIALPATCVAFAALMALILATRLEATVWLLFPAAALVGFMPSFGALVRARWTQLYRGQAKLRTAFAFESVVDEAVYIVGPIVAIGLSVSLFPEAGPVAAAVLLAVGAAAFITQRATEPLIHEQGVRGVDVCHRALAGARHPSRHGRHRSDLRHGRSRDRGICRSAGAEGGGEPCAR